ncbi:hypothetical protein C8F04DRAFT_1155253 [Mycena alexandri]|uniref:Uncharacterized protein n=1 Tax=Mycena alexandri TaxID=1745969 RepID=A0AAD6RZR2_9AGAR|nr:hypothetical protein C8F04DRAFT_1155253 [Mycena alexandri]
MSTNEFERTSSHLAKNLGGNEKIEQVGDSGPEGPYVYVSPPATTKAFYDISVALSLSPPTIGPQGRVRQAVFDDWLCGIMELHAELSRDRKLQSEAEHMFTELAESLEEIKKVEQEREGELARHRQEILDQQSEIKHTSSQLAQSLGKTKKVEQEWDVMEMACKSERMRRQQTGVGILQDDLAKCRETIQRPFGKIEQVEKERLVMEMARNAEQMRRLELEERFRARQAEAVALQTDLEQARGRCSELEAELKRTKMNDEARKDEEISNRNAAREEGRDDMLTEIIQLLNSKRENDQGAKQAEKDRVEKERAEKMRKAERELAEELERSRCQKRDEKYKNARIWTDALAFDRFETILVVEEFNRIKFGASTPLTFEALPWPVLARPGTYTANDITADHVRAFFRTPVATSAKSATHPIPAEYRKYLVKQGLLAFHGDKMVARISTVEDKALCQQILETANIITQTLNEIMPRA